MGRILLAGCKSCSYSAKSLFGGGRRDHKVNFSVPAMDRGSRTIKSVNYLDSKDDPNFEFYCHEKMKGNSSGGTIESHSLVLNCTNNYCPRCDSFTLDFERVGMFD